MKLNKPKAMIMSMGMVLSVLVFTPLHAEAEPTLKQTMDWLSDYLPRETGCTDEDSITMFVTKSSYDSQQQAMHYAMHRQDGDNGKTRDPKVVLPLYTLEKLETIGSSGCWKVTWRSKEKNIRLSRSKNDVSFTGAVNILLFRTEDAAKRVAKALRHAGSLAVKPHRSELF